MMANRGWLTLISHIAVFILLLSMHNTNISHGFESHISHLITVLNRHFSTAPAKMLAIFLLLAPSWGVFITRKQTFFGALVWLISWLWCIAIILFFFNKITIEPWLYWFFYATLMLFLGLVGILFRTFGQNAEQWSSSQSD